MSRFTNFGENRLIDFFRGQDPALPADWSVGLLGSFDSDGSFTELAGVGYDRQQITRSLTNFAGTQAPGSVLASTGTSHATSTNVDIDFGVAGSAWGTAEYLGFFDDSSDAECWFVMPLPAPLVIGNGDPVLILAGDISFTLGLAGGLSNYASNKLIDLIFRGQAFTWPASVYLGYSITTPTNAAAGTEPLGGYARVAVASSLAAWSGTQGAGTTDPSDGESGEMSNNAQVLFPMASADQGVATHSMAFDASTVGNLLFWAALASPSTVNVGTQPRFEPGEYRVRVA